MQLASTLESALRHVTDLVFPQTCVHCNNPGRLLCDTCLHDAERIGSAACRSCGMQIEYDNLCGKCAASPPALTGLTGVFNFEGAIKDAVHALKYRDLRAIAPSSAQNWPRPRTGGTRTSTWSCPCRCTAADCGPAATTRPNSSPGPWRRASAPPWSTYLLARVTDNPPQAQAKNEAARSAGVRNAFTASNEVDGKRVLLIDDVATTCSTLDACARALSRAGAKSVRAAVLAREL